MTTSLQESLQARGDETEALAARAVEERSTLREAASKTSLSERAARALEYRAFRCLRDTPGGADLAELFLKKRSWYRLEAAALLVCRPDEVDDVIARGLVPLVWIARHVPSGERAYHFWYTQMSRNHPAALQQMQAQPGARVQRPGKGGRTLSASHAVAEPANPAFSGGYNFFDVDTYEFASDCQ